VRLIFSQEKNVKVGFKLEWKESKNELLKKGHEALENMNADIVVLNNLDEIDSNHHQAYIIDRSAQITEVVSKEEIMNALIEKLAHVL
jgi:phosphopantothenate---cysteine ligase (CTP)